MERAAAAMTAACDRPVMLIVGGTGTIGSAIAAQADPAQWRVIVHGRSHESTSAALTRLNRPADDVATVACDAFVAGAMSALIEQALGAFGRIDAVVDCVTGGPPGVTGRFTEMEPRAFAGLLDASVGHLQRLALAALPVLARQGGALIAFASDAGRFAAPGQAAIGASRAGIIGFVRNLALEVARDGVRVNCVSPSFVEGSASLERVEARVAQRIVAARARAGLGLPTAADIAPLVLFLCGDGARKITGQVVSVNGGMNA